MMTKRAKTSRMWWTPFSPFYLLSGSATSPLVGNHVYAVLCTSLYIQLKAKSWKKNTLFNTGCCPSFLLALVQVSFPLRSDHKGNATLTRGRWIHAASPRQGTIQPQHNANKTGKLTDQVTHVWWLLDFVGSRVHVSCVWEMLWHMTQATHIWNCHKKGGKWCNDRPRPSWMVNTSRPRSSIVNMSLIDIP